MKKFSFQDNFINERFNFGLWVTCPDLMICEIISHLGYDFIAIDTEHSFITIESLRDMLIVIRKSSTFPIVRVGWNDITLIKQVLDAGAEGIIIPMVCSKEEAEKAVAYCKYPPDGIRGLGPLGACDFGRNFFEYVATANDRIFVIIQIEHIKAVKNLDEILQVRGVDAIFIGPADLAASMGHIDNFSHQEVQEQISLIINIGLSHKVPVGIAIGGSGEQIWERLKSELLGIRFLTTGSDMDFLTRIGKEMLSRLKSDT